MNHIDWIGFVGVFQILLAYILNIAGIMNKDKLPFIFLNIVGAGMACLASILMWYWPFIILEGAWATVSILSLKNYTKRKNHGR